MKDKIKMIMADIFGISVVDLPENPSIDSVLQWDSLNHLRLMIELENSFNVSLEPEEMAELISLSAIYNKFNI